MAKNKKAQILAAVMCAATVVGVTPVFAESVKDDAGTTRIDVADGSIIGQAENNLTFTVGDNKFSMDQYGTNTGALDVRGNFHVNNGVSAFAVENNKLTASVGTTSLEMTPNGVVLNGNTTVNGNVTAEVITGEMIQNANGTFVANANGDVIARSVTVDGFKINSPDGAYLDISGTKIYKDGGFSTGNMNFSVRPNGDLQMGPDNKFTVQAATGNVITEGNLTTNSLSIGTNAVTGEPAFTVNDEGYVRTEYGGEIGGVTLNGGRVVATTGISAANGQFSVDGGTGAVSATNVTTDEGR
ncbi:hypothetical protein [Megamonas hypermegale]|uniref:hypothetical protein n=1 Tax=Megamonas hypermegale TaxID=158847 RepID=UPI0026EA49DD|nr:hypothetical protein [Megamonas hypermegale]